MTLQASGAIKLSEVQTEFGGSNPISLSEYYGVAVGVPGSGTIKLSDFYGTSSADDTLDAFTWSPDTTIGPGDDNSQVTLAGIDTTITLRATLAGFSLGSIVVEIERALTVVQTHTFVGDSSHDYTVQSGDIVRVTFYDLLAENTGNPNGTMTFTNETSATQTSITNGAVTFEYYSLGGGPPPS